MMISSTMHAGWCTAPTRSTGMGLPLGRVLPQVWNPGLVSAFHPRFRKKEYTIAYNIGGRSNLQHETHRGCLLLQVQRRCMRVVNVMSPSRPDIATGKCSTFD